LKLQWTPRLLLVLTLALTAAVYWPGLSGGWLFDDFPNIVDNKNVQPTDASISSLTAAALSSPSSSIKRPLASLSFAANYLADGLNPFGWKLANLVIHLLNGALVYWLTRLLTGIVGTKRQPKTGTWSAALVAAAWLLAPINLTGVLYVVQRMESLANLFVLLGLVGYVTARQRMLVHQSIEYGAHERRCLIQATASLMLGTTLGLMAKETAVMLPLYAFLIEWIVFDFSSRNRAAGSNTLDKRVATLFIIMLLLPMLAGLAWLLPGVLNPAAWATRDFTLATRLLTESRVVCEYLLWTLLPTPQALSFYHDNFPISTGLIHPWTTAVSIMILIMLAVSVPRLRRSQPLAGLGIALFLGSHLLTATILPLELVFEHRNYFASFGVLLAIIPLLADTGWTTRAFRHARWFALSALLLLWASLTAITASAWGNPLLLAETLAARAPDSPRAQYELGRTYIILSHYDKSSPFTAKIAAPLERAAGLPHASILPEQALIFAYARMHLPVKDVWWDSLVAKLKARRPGVQDESSLGALTKCARNQQCDLPLSRMTEAYLAALSHPNPAARLLASYADYAWNVLGDQELGLSMAQESVNTQPSEPAYRITLARMLAVQDRFDEVQEQIHAMESLNYGGRLNSDIKKLRALLPVNMKQ